MQVSIVPITVTVAIVDVFVVIYHAHESCRHLIVCFD